MMQAGALFQNQAVYGGMTQGKLKKLLQIIGYHLQSLSGQAIHQIGRQIVKTSPRCIFHCLYSLTA